MAHQHEHGSAHGEHGSARHPVDLASRVKDALMRETESAGVDIQVEGRDPGMVRLHGVVDTLSQKEAAIRIASQVQGVKDVVNDITLGFEKGWTDDRVRAAIHKKLADHREMEAVSVEVVEGTVRLLGHVESGSDEQEAIRLAAGVPGVKEVKSALKVGEGRGEDDAAVARYARRLLAQMGLNPRMFTIWVDDGTLFIRGLVPAESEAGRIKRMLSRLDGVQEIDAVLPVDKTVNIYAGRGGKDVIH